MTRAATPPPPRQVLLFSGHLVDTPERARPRFPADKVGAAARRIAAELDVLDAGPADLAITQGAAGGDLLFAEACLARGVPVQLLLPLPEPEFIAQSMLPCVDGAAWRERYRAVKTRLTLPPLQADAVLGPLPAGADPFERANRWLLDSALAHGAKRLRFITLWDGAGGDGPGGTQHMVDEVRRRHGELRWIDTRAL
ncbi:hypothetical protein [Variovorax sp. YR752]|uniref:hypothetical protein n=1 Tax=Variovorax sp. YR752 TaxID=1884383 RepID=UPI003137EE57